MPGYPRPRYRKLPTSERHRLLYRSRARCQRCAEGERLEHRHCIARADNGIHPGAYELGAPPEEPRIRQNGIRCSLPFSPTMQVKAIGRWIDDGEIQRLLQRAPTRPQSHYRLVANIDSSIGLSLITWFRKALIVQAIKLVFADDQVVPVAGEASNSYYCYPRNYWWFYRPYTTAEEGSAPFCRVVPRLRQRESVQGSADLGGWSSV
jgi:hypothetical protein